LENGNGKTYGFTTTLPCGRVVLSSLQKKDPIVRLGLKEGLPGSVRDGRLWKMETAKPMVLPPPYLVEE
jgi:hypothetical protein